MFKVKRIDTGEIQTVLSVEFDNIFHQTHFLVWDNNGWRWRPATKYVPPNVNPNEIKSIKKYKESTELIDDDPPFAKGGLLNGKNNNNN